MMRAGTVSTFEHPRFSEHRAQDRVHDHPGGRRGGGHHRGKPPRCAHEPGGGDPGAEADQAEHQSREPEGGGEEEVGDQAGDESEGGAPLGAGRIAGRHRQEEHGIGVRSPDAHGVEEGLLDDQYDEDRKGGPDHVVASHGAGSHCKTSTYCSPVMSTTGSATTVCWVDDGDDENESPPPLATRGGTVRPGVRW